MIIRAGVLACLPMILFAAGAFGQELHVTVTGEVARPGTYSAQKGDRISSLIERAGGFTDNAWLRGASIIRKAAGAEREMALRELISRIGRDVFVKSGEEERKKEFLATLQTLSPSPRLPVKLAHPRLLKGTGDDLTLEDGDALTVPSKSAPVTVTGAVNSPGIAAPYAPNANAAAYIKRAGGYTEEADRKHLYLLKANGAAIPISNEWIRWNPGESRWEIPAFGEKQPPPEPGDTVVVPKKPRSAWARDDKELPHLLMEIHALTGVRVDLP